MKALVGWADFAHSSDAPRNEGTRITMRRREAYRSELLCGGNRLAREASWPSQAPMVYLRGRTENFHV